MTVKTISCVCRNQTSAGTNFVQLADKMKIQQLPVFVSFFLLLLILYSGKILGHGRITVKQSEAEKNKVNNSKTDLICHEQQGRLIF